MQVRNPEDSQFNNHKRVRVSFQNPNLKEILSFYYRNDLFLIYILINVVVDEAKVGENALFDF